MKNTNEEWPRKNAENTKMENAACVFLAFLRGKLFDIPQAFSGGARACESHYFRASRRSALPRRESLHGFVKS
jgi:hypothetical protein